MNTHMALNFMRSANAPAIRAGVMIAKVIWNIMYTLSGIVYAVELSVPAPRVKGTSTPLVMWSPRPLRKKREKSPMKGAEAPVPLVNARL